MKPRSRNNKRTFLPRAFLYCAACASYIFAFPVGSHPGFGLFALVSLTFFLLWMESLKLEQIVSGAAFAGAMIHLALTSWLGNYHPFALIVSMITGALRFMLLFSALFLISGATPWLRRITGILAITCIPILSAWGFLAFPYATLPYAMDSSRFAFFLASMGGTSLVALVMACINYGLYEALKSIRSKSVFPRIVVLVPILFIGLLFLIPTQSYKSGTNGTVIKQISSKQEKKADTIRVALIQPNMPQKQTGLDDYKAVFSVLKNLTDKAMEFQPDLIVWHETSIVPALAWHIKYRPLRETYEFAHEVQDYLLASPSAVLLGTSWVPESDAERNSDFNSAVLYNRGAISDIYGKMKLVPFSEYFPLANRAPALNDWLVSRFGPMRTPGTRRTVFTVDNASFAAPICFEDSFSAHFSSFPELDFFTVLTEDSWAKSPSMQKQHALMSKFRAAETASVVLRVGNTGNTIALDPNGHAAAALDPFSSGYLVVDILKKSGKKTVFELYGSYLPAVFAVITASLISAILAGFIQTKRKNRQEI